MTKAPASRVVDIETEDGLQEMYDLAISKKGRSAPNWLVNKMHAMGMGDKIHGQDDGEPPNNRQEGYQTA